jgi:hypothetical protein
MATGPVTCPAGVYTAISSGATDVSFRVKEMEATTVLRLVNAASLPAINEDSFISISDHEWKAFSSVLNNLYVMPIGSNAILEIIDNN